MGGGKGLNLKDEVEVLAKDFSKAPSLGWKRLDDSSRRIYRRGNLVLKLENWYGCADGQNKTEARVLKSRKLKKRYLGRWYLLDRKRYVTAPRLYAASTNYEAIIQSFCPGYSPKWGSKLMEILEEQRWHGDLCYSNIKVHKHIVYLVDLGYS